ncbi:hypothetical protein FB451DRAFT_1256289 [Mycena latifolia]|nr:hypothetical protein FB451DRAFT_1256289 [Mycena latifolia]
MWSLRAAGISLCVLGYVALTSAVYYIDDQDSSVIYNSSSGVGYNDKWHKYSYNNSNSLAVSVDERKCFDGTATYTTCYTSDHCSFTIPFNGTGITLFVAQDFGDIYNASISLDGAPSTIHFAYNKENVEAYNATLYDIQGLNWTTHTVKVELAPDGMRLLWDYAAVTGDKPAGNSGAATIGNSAAMTTSLASLMVLALAFGASLW